MLEMFNTLLRQLRLSIDYALTGSYDGAISLGTKIIKEHEERMFQEAVIKTIGARGAGQGAGPGPGTAPGGGELGAGWRSLGGGCHPCKDVSPGDVGLPPTPIVFFVDTGESGVRPRCTPLSEWPGPA